MLCAPLDADGLIDEPALARQPAMATVRRFWPNEPDRSGYLVRKDAGWTVCFVPDDHAEESFVEFGDHPLRLGGSVALRKPDGCVYPFRIAGLQPDGVAS